MGQDLLSTLRWERPATAELGVTGFAAPPMVPSTDRTARLIEAVGLPNVPPAFAKTPADEAAYLLRTASQVEHGLLVQYLYAAYSIDDQHDPDDLATRLLDIAIQEMDHLLNVQNMLLLLKWVPYFDRPNYPLPPATAAAYPFPFQFEPIGTGSLGKYVSAESPDPSLGPIDLSKLTKDQQDAFRDAVAAGTAAAGVMINHVGAIYAKLYWMFQEDDTPIAPWDLSEAAKKGYFKGVRHLSPGDFGDPTKLVTREGLAKEFGGKPGPEQPGVVGKHRVIWTVLNAQNVRDAIHQIAEQGEGTQMTMDSHFVEFLDIFRSFRATPPTVLKVPTHPNTGLAPATASGRIDPSSAAAAWARLLNARYRMLLTELALILSESVGENAGMKGRSGRKALIGQAIFGEMHGDYGIRSLARRLATLPRLVGGDPKNDAAAAPFEMPSIDLPTTPEGHRDLMIALIDESAAAIASLLALSGADALVQADRDGLDQVKTSDADLRADVAAMTFTP